MDSDNSDQKPGRVPKDPVRLAWAMMNQELPDLSEVERRQTWAALLAASVPHALEVTLLAALCETTALVAERMVESLRRLSCIIFCGEPSEEGFKVDPAVRLPLREFLRIWHPDRWQRYSRKCHARFKKGKDAASRIEALYHLFPINPTAAAWNCQVLSDYFRDGPWDGDRDALAKVLTELTQTYWNRELAISLARIAHVHFHLDSPLAALGSLEKSRKILETLCAQYTGHSGMKQQLETIRIRLNAVGGNCGR